MVGTLRSILSLMVSIALSCTCFAEEIETLKQKCAGLEDHHNPQIAKLAKLYNGQLEDYLGTRTWQDKSRQFSLEARCVAYATDTNGNGWLQLEKQDGSKVAVKTETLAASGQAAGRLFVRTEQLLELVAQAEASRGTLIENKKAEIIERLGKQVDWPAVVEKRGADWPANALANARWVMVRQIDPPEQWLNDGETMPAPDGSAAALHCPVEYRGPGGDSRRSKGGALNALGASFASLDYLLDLQAANLAAQYVAEKRKPGKDFQGEIKQRAIYGLSITAQLPLYRGDTGAEIAKKLGEKTSPPDFNEAATVAWWPRFCQLYEDRLAYRQAYQQVYRGQKDRADLDFGDKHPVVDAIYEWHVFITHKQGENP